LNVQVNVFVSDTHQDAAAPQLLVLPFGPMVSVPGHLHHVSWRYFATTEADDRIIGLTKGEVEVALARDGYLLVAPGQ
jgi:hypothetical protein